MYGPFINWPLKILTALFEYEITKVQNANKINDIRVHMITKTEADLFCDIN